MGNNRVTATVKYNKKTVIGFHEWLIEKAGDSSLADVFYTIALDSYFTEKRLSEQNKTLLSNSVTHSDTSVTPLVKNDESGQDDNMDWLDQYGAESS